MPTRQLRNWLTTWTSYYEQTEVPIDYSVWSGLWCISSVLQDNVYIQRGHERLYPNNYIFLIGPAGGGKSYSAKQALEFIETLQSVETYSGEMSKSYMCTYLESRQSTAKALNPGTRVLSKLALYSDELANTVGSGPAGTDFLKLMTQIYSSSFTYGTQKHGYIKLEQPAISWLALATNSWLKRSIPPDLVDSGTIARIIAVVGTLKNVIVPELPEMSQILKSNLISDLYSISQLKGEYTLSPEAREYHNEWYIRTRGKRLKIQDEITRDIYGREDEHSLRICMALMAARGDSKEITLRAIENATGFVTQARASNINLFRSLAMTDRLSEVKSFMAGQIQTANGIPISQTDLRKMTRGRVGTNEQFNSAIDALLQEYEISRYKSPSGEWIYRIKGEETNREST